MPPIPRYTTPPPPLFFHSIITIPPGQKRFDRFPWQNPYQITSQSDFITTHTGARQMRFYDDYDISLQWTINACSSGPPNFGYIRIRFRAWSGTLLLDTRDNQTSTTCPALTTWSINENVQGCGRLEFFFDSIGAVGDVNGNFNVTGTGPV